MYTNYIPKIIFIHTQKIKRTIRPQIYKKISFLYNNKTSRLLYLYQPQPR